jgi:hypothetical protein
MITRPVLLRQWASATSCLQRGHYGTQQERAIALRSESSAEMQEATSLRTIRLVSLLSITPSLPLPHSPSTPLRPTDRPTDDLPPLLLRVASGVFGYQLQTGFVVVVVVLLLFLGVCTCRTSSGWVVLHCSFDHWYVVVIVVVDGDSMVVALLVVLATIGRVGLQCLIPYQ